TLAPKLGVVFHDDKKSFVLADIPGLISGASSGAGLGHQFLKHIQRTKLLLHFVDFSAGQLNLEYPQSENRIIDSIEKNILEIIHELQLFNSELVTKQRWLVFTKIDLVPIKIREERWKLLSKRLQSQPIFFVSSFSREGIDHLLESILEWMNCENKCVSKDFEDDVRFKNFN
ncbi:MAG: hypothetical protein CBD16_08495, partial [Betaproteobacteria bacterium TMED156]